MARSDDPRYRRVRSAQKLLVSRRSHQGKGDHRVREGRDRSRSRDQSPHRTMPFYFPTRSIRHPDRSLRCPACGANSNIIIIDNATVTAGSSTLREGRGGQERREHADRQVGRWPAATGPTGTSTRRMPSCSRGRCWTWHRPRQELGREEGVEKGKARRKLKEQPEHEVGSRQISFL